MARAGGGVATSTPAWVGAPEASRAAEAPAAALFDMDVSLERVAIWTQDGEEFLGWPRPDAEAILDVFETRIPRLQATLDACEHLNSLQEQRVQIYADMIAQTASVAGSWEAVANSWKQAASDAAPAPSVFERVLTAPTLWFVLGVTAGAIGAKLLINR